MNYSSIFATDYVSYNRNAIPHVIYWNLSCTFGWIYVSYNRNAIPHVTSWSHYGLYSISLSRIRNIFQNNQVYSMNYETYNIFIPIFRNHTRNHTFSSMNYGTCNFFIPIFRNHYKINNYTHPRSTFARSKEYTWPKAWTLPYFLLRAKNLKTFSPIQSTI